MSKSFSYISRFALIFALIFVVGGFVLPETTLANHCDPETELEYPNFSGDGHRCVPVNNPEENSGGGILDEIFSFAADALLAPFGWISLLILQITTWLLYAAGLVLNLVVQYTIVDMKTNMQDATVINTTWALIRDIANMGFIFVLLYAAIKTILGMGSDTKKLIINVIVVAILINFSLFFTKVVIDASNIIAIAFYDAIAPGALDGGINTGLSGVMMEPLKLGTIWDNVNLQNAFDGRRIILIGILGSIFVLIASFVFFAMAILFVIRFVVLIIVLILSPIAFIAFVIPGLSNVGKQWREALFNQAFFAPIYFLLTYIVITIVNSDILGDLSSGGFASTFTENKTGDTGNGQLDVGPMGIVLNFFIIITFLIASLTISKSWANKAGGAVANINKWALGAADGARRGVTRMAAYYPQRGIAALDEKFGEKKFAYTAIGSTLRKMTTGGLTNVKMGGKTASETKKDYDLRRERMEDIKAFNEAEDATKNRKTDAQIEEEVNKKEHENEKARLAAVKTATEGADSAVQRKMMKISPRSFTNMAKHNFFDKNFMRHATTAQFLALMSSSVLTEDEKKKAIEARFENMADALKEYETKKKTYDENLSQWRSRVANPDKLSEKEEGELVQIGPAPKIAGFDEIRNKSAKEYELLNQHDKFGLLESGDFVSVIRSDTIGGLRSGDAFTVAEKDKLRELKNDSIVKNAALIENLEKLPESDPTGNKLKWAQKDLEKAMTGKSAAEVAGLPGGKGWKKPAVIRLLDRTTLPKFIEKDDSDKEIIINQFIEDAKKGKLTNANRKAVEWILTDRIGKGFLSRKQDELAEAYDTLLKKELAGSGNTPKGDAPKIEVPQGYRTRK